MEFKVIRALFVNKRRQIAAFLVIAAYLFNTHAMSQIDTRTFNQQLNTIYQDSLKQQQVQLMNQEKYFDSLWFTKKATGITSNKSNSTIQNLIDQSYFALLKYDRFKDVIQILMNSDPQLISKLLGTSDIASRQISKITKTKQVWLEIPHKKINHREFVFIFTAEDTPINSWTNLFNVTYIIINPNSVTLDLFERILLHELFMILDFKEQFLSLPLKDGIFPKIKQENLCHLRQAIKDPMIKYVFSLIRGLNFENAILNIQNNLNHEINQSKDCILKVKSFLPVIEKFKLMLEPELKLIQSINFGECSNDENRMIDEKLETIRLSTVTSDQGNILSICEYLSEPEISLWTFSATIGGPRPRIGNGWGSFQTKQPLETQQSHFGIKYQNLQKMKSVEKYEIKSK